MGALVLAQGRLAHGEEARVLVRLANVAAPALVAFLGNESRRAFDLLLEEMWQFSHEAIVEHSKWVKTLNGHRFWVRPPLTDHLRPGDWTV